MLKVVRSRKKLAADGAAGSFRKKLVEQLLLYMNAKLIFKKELDNSKT